MPTMYPFLLPSPPTGSSLNTEGKEPPNGGLSAWLQVFGGHLIFFNSWGLVNTFGAYQAFYEDSLFRSQASSRIAWIGTFQAFLLVSFSIISGPLFDRGYFRVLLVVGSFLIVLGMTTASLATEYWQMFLSQGLCVGLGGGCLFTPTVAVVSTYFNSKRALAIGIVAAGGSVGSTLYPIIFRKLQPEIGFAWTTRIIAFIALGLLLISISVMRTRLLPPKRARAFVDVTAFRNKPYAAFTIGLFLVFTGLYIPIFDQIVYAQKKAHIDIDMSFYLLSVLNAASAFGRVIPGLIADMYGSLEIIIICTVCSAVFVYSWVGITSLAGFICFSVVYGFMSGAVVSIQASVVASLVPQVRLVGTWMGMTLFISGLGLLIGSPISGILVDKTVGSFAAAYIFSGTLVTAGGIMFIASYVMRERESGRSIRLIGINQTDPNRT